MQPPFILTGCSWPQPVEQAGERWTSAPAWDAPRMPGPPAPHWDLLEGEPCAIIDWRAWFTTGLRWPDWTRPDLRGFHVVFDLQIPTSGTLIFWADDGCVIRQNGVVVHEDRAAHGPQRRELAVQAGDHLQVAQWQFGWDWVWGARLAPPGAGRPLTPDGTLGAYLAPVQTCLRRPEGPPLKLYTHGRAPLRTILAIYSLVLNGYAPAGVALFGENEWPAETRALFARLLPFAQVVPAAQVVARLHELRAPQLARWAQRHWFVMKMCVALLYPPDEFCLIDDDVFVLDRLDEALAAFADHDLVFTPDQDLGAGYQATWLRHAAPRAPFATTRFSAGLYWARPITPPAVLAAQALRVSPEPVPAYLWEQGFIANVYARQPVVELPSRRYPFVVFHGLPGGLYGYDYVQNPCGFASLHFGGLPEKPSELSALHLAPEILDRARTLRTDPASRLAAPAGLAPAMVTS